jgi:hypothetical protein
MARRPDRLHHSSHIGIVVCGCGCTALGTAQAVLAEAFAQAIADVTEA